MSSILENTKMAIELEEKGYEFYIQTANNTSNQLARSTLTSLAERELLHKEKIVELFDALSKKSGIKADHSHVNPGKKELLMPILAKLKASLGKTFKTTEDINEAYKIAEGLEKDSFMLYEKIANESTDSMIKQFYLSLAAEEKDNYAILDETLEYLNNPGEWYRLKERWIVEG